MALKKGFSRTPRSVGLILLGLFAAACTRHEAVPELRVMTWTDYLRPEVVKTFEAANHVKVILDYFSSNEELLAKVQSSVDTRGRGYDLILPSDYMVTSMVRLKLLQPIDKKKLAFIGDYDATFSHPSYDPNLEHCVPFAFGTTGVAVNTKLAPKFDFTKGVSWRDFYENPALKGKVTLMDDAREVLHTALLINGKKWSTATEADVKEAFAYLKKHKSNIKIFAPEARPVMQNDECALCQAFSGDVLQTAITKPELKFVIPNEGATIWADNWAIPVNAKSPELSYAFMNTVLAAESAKKFTTVTFYPTPNTKARDLLPADIRQNKGVYPDANIFGRLAFIPERAELLQLMDRLWTELKSE